MARRARKPARVASVKVILVSASMAETGLPVASRRARVMRPEELALAEPEMVALMMLISRAAKPPSPTILAPSMVRVPVE